MHLSEELELLFMARAANRNRKIRPYSRTVLHAVTVPSGPKLA